MSVTDVKRKHNRVTYRGSIKAGDVVLNPCSISLYYAKYGSILYVSCPNKKFSKQIPRPFML